MLYHERKQMILELFQGKTTLKVADISAALEVSVDTVRRDLKQMEKENLLKYIFGGAILNEEWHHRQYGNFSSRIIKNKELKQELAKKAIAEINEGDVIFINSGTTGTIFAEEVAKQCEHISVLTNSIEIINLFIEIGNPTIDVTCLGGTLDVTEKSIYGYQCEQELAQYFPDVCFLSLNAVDKERGYTDFRTQEVGLMRAAQKSGKRVVALMDSTKFGGCSRQMIFTPTEVAVIYSDELVSEDVVQEYAEVGIVIL
ncbi:DeoR/GlpR family DNA-binding transcription regulator [Chakrabartyella piscis]|uniref:DeoR/GlpR family DNA-binding transcription regulator n=1 Tax=Chakrabartyella piscis TaxID=2918914 RepID=UPI002958984F|nr:DeoR/GlpR family DNA-binding transcription regulator [Chakrabartyella piscis]